MRGVVPVTIFAFITYIIFTGSLTPYDVATGAVVAIVIGLLLGGYLVENDLKALNPARWLWGVVYFLWYLLVAEVKSHLDVMMRIITREIEPGIVKVPVRVKTEYARALVANSITNTPGTVVVDIDEDYIYVNWINVTTEDPEKARMEISADFEKYAEKIFE